MSKNFKALPAQLSDKLIGELKEGNSLFQKPLKENGLPAFVTPVNPTTGKGYSALNALALAMKRYDDPRWMSADAARFAGSLVKKGETGTLIEFPKKNDIQAIRTPEGAKIKGDDGKTQTKTVEFEKVQQGKAFLFNAAQLNNIEPLEKYLEKQNEGQSLSPIDRAEKMLADSKAVIIHGGQEAFYDKKRDAIFLPEKSEFENETKYYQAAIHQLAHWTGHESRQNRPMEGKFGSLDYAREELRAATAAMLIGGELKLGHNFGQHAAYSNNWQKILKDEPFEIAKVARDAQKIASALLNAGQKKEVKQGAELATGFKKDDVIHYMDTSYTVLDVKAKSIKVEDTSGTKTNVKSTDGLYKSLLEAKNNPREPEMAMAEEQEQGQAQEQTHKIGR
jgi:antirestriction protein ArdC